MSSAHHPKLIEVGDATLRNLASGGVSLLVPKSIYYFDFERHSGGLLPPHAKRIHRKVARNPRPKTGRFPARLRPSAT